MVFPRINECFDFIWEEIYAQGKSLSDEKGCIYCMWWHVIEGCCSPLESNLIKVTFQDDCAGGMLKLGDREAWRKGHQLENYFSGPGIRC